MEVKQAEMEKETSEAQRFVDFLVAKNHKEFDITYEGFLCNHAAHGLCTLFALGASTERLKEYYDTYSLKLEELRTPRFKIHESNWEDYICDTEGYPELLPFFEEQVEILGIENALTKFIPRLLPGFVGAVFHPLIQIGFGVEFQLPHVVAEGLAYACTYYYRAGEIINRLPEDDGTPSMDPLDIALEMKSKNIERLTALNRNPNAPWEKLFDSEDAEMIQLVSKWKVNANTTEEILEKFDELSLAILVVVFGSYKNGSIDFFLMHNFTSLQAIRVLLPYLPLHEQKRLLQVTLVGMLGNFWLVGMPDFETKKIMDYSGLLEGILWDKIIEKAIVSDDPHVGKVVRALVVMRDNIPKNTIPPELILLAAKMTTDFIATEDDWEFGGIGYQGARQGS